MNAIRVSKSAGRKLGMISIGAMAVLAVVVWPAKGTQTVITITGTLLGGADRLPIFDVGKNLDKQPFTLVYTFDDAKGKPSPAGRCGDVSSGIEGGGTNSPGKAVLTIGTKSYTFGTI